jgi:hypothetical protein
MPELEVHQPKLGQEDWDLIHTLLRGRQRELLTETRHTASRSFRERLLEELGQIEALLEKIPSHEE